jgi:DNA-binding NtrC family response regulator
MCVVVIDEDGDLRDTVVAALQEAAVTVFAFVAVSEAIHFMEGVLSPCLVLVDVSSGSLDDHEVAIRVQRSRRLCDLAVVVYTATPECAPPGCPAFAKQLELDELVAAVRALVPHRGVTR